MKYYVMESEPYFKTGKSDWVQVTADSFSDYSAFPLSEWKRKVEVDDPSAYSAAADLADTMAKLHPGPVIAIDKDDVKQPSHYNVFGVHVNQQAIDVMRAALTPAEFIGYCKGNILKYRLRAGNKGDALKDIAKANEYTDILNTYVAGQFKCTIADASQPEEGLRG